MGQFTKRLFLFLSPVFWSFVFGTPQVRAEITLKSYPTYLRNTVEDATTKEITMYAGRTLQNDIDCTTNNPTFTDINSTCNSCAKLANQVLSSPLPCNDQEIHANLPFTVILSSSDAADYTTTCPKPIVARVAGDSTNIFTTTNQTTVVPGIANQDVTATFTWSQLCGQAGASGCSGSFDTKFEFGFDRECSQTALSSTGKMIRIRFRYVTTSPAMTLGCVNARPYEGICNYIASPGDQKVFIKNTDGSIGNGFLVPDLTAGDSDTADDSNMTYAAFRLYYRSIADGAPAAMTYADTHQDLAISDTTLADNRVTNLTNGVSYYFWGAMVDQAGTVTHLPVSLTTDQSATPEQVFGLLDEKGCFVATAAYGTEQAHEIHILREFRDLYLARTVMGRAFIRFYYSHSPSWAAVIRDHEALRAIARSILGPMIGVADLSLRYGAWVFYLCFLGIFSFFGLCILVARWRGHRRSR